MADNAAHLVGNVTRDPELRFTNSGMATASFGVAINSRKKDASGEWVDADPAFFDIVTFGTLAENVAESIARGHRVVVVGRMNYSSWETDEGKRSKVEIVADSVGPCLRWATASITRNEKKS